MGCNTSQEPAAVSVDNENAVKTDDGIDIDTEADIKNENSDKPLNDSSNEAPIANGDPLGKDEGKLVNK